MRISYIYYIFAIVFRAVEELAWAKHTSIVTDYGEDVWGPRGRQGRRNSGQKYARGDSPDEEAWCEQV